jgi:Amt family ammonium transporter
VKGFNPDPALDAVQVNGLFFGQSQLLISELEAIVITAVIAVVGTLIALWITKLFTKDLRVSEKDEELGLDLSEHGECAYDFDDSKDKALLK